MVKLPETMHGEKHHHLRGEKHERTPEEQLKHHKHLGSLAKVATVAAGAYALHEKHNAKKHPEHARDHKIKEEIAATVAVGSAGIAFHEHHEKKAAKEKIEHEKKQSH